MSTPEITGLDKNGVLSAAEDAAKAPTKFSPRERAAYVKERVDEVRRLIALGQNDVQIKEALGSFVDQYPTLFQYAVLPDFDYKQFEKMLGMLDKMGSGMTQHQASIAVGQILVDKYVKPMIR
jgi:hypothetical protein